MAAGWLVGDKALRAVVLRVFSLVTINSVFHLVSKVSDQTLHRPRCGVSQCANRVSLHLQGKLLEHVNFGKVGVSNLDSLENIVHPARSFSARRALSTRLVSVEMSKAQNGVDDICLLVHYDHSSCSQGRALVFKSIEVHDGVLAVFSRDHRS